MDKERDDTSFGIIPVRKKMGKWELFMVQHKNGAYWSFPKGHPNEGEDFKETAIRELKEETGLEVVNFLDAPLFIEKYSFLWKGSKINKTVHYFLAEVKGKVVLQAEEILAGKWIYLTASLTLATYPEAKKLLKEVAIFFSKSNL